MPNGVTLIAGHNIIMDSAYADEKFARGEITNKQIITTQKDWDAVEQGKVGTLEEQSPVSAWSGVTEQPKEELTDAQIAAEEQARAEAQGYVVNGGVDWSRVEVDMTPSAPKELVATTETITPVAPVVSEKAKLFEEFEEFLQWKQTRKGK